MLAKLSTISNNLVFTIVLAFLAVGFGTAATRYQDKPQSDRDKMASNSDRLGEKSSAGVSAETVPIYTKFMDVRLGMPASEVRKKLRNLKEKSDRQDYFVFSDMKTAQVFYDSQGRVSAISIDYFGLNNEVPTPEQVLGDPVQPKVDGSIYKLERNQDAGYWVAYSRTAGENPITTLTIQKEP